MFLELPVVLTYDIFPAHEVDLQISELLTRFDYLLRNKYIIVQSDIDYLQTVSTLALSNYSPTQSYTVSNGETLTCFNFAQFAINQKKFQNVEMFATSLSTPSYL